MRARAHADHLPVVVPFGRNESGDLVPLEPTQAPNAESAQRRAKAAAAKHGGAVAFSRTGDPNTGEFGDATILATSRRPATTCWSSRSTGGAVLFVMAEDGLAIPAPSS